MKTRIMALHQKPEPTSKVFRIKGSKVTRLDGVTTVEFGPFATNWPKFARKVEALGFPVQVSKSANRVVIECRAEMKLVQEILKGHRRGRKNLLPIFAMVATVAIGMLANIRLGESEVNVKPKTASTPNICSPQSIEDWLVSGKQNDSISLMQSNSLGGVTVGVLSCSEHRYSYTLELKEPKRVLKLETLDP
jgi:hypothetical protein